MTLTAERARELFEYDPDTGVIRRRAVSCARPSVLSDAIRTLDKDGYIVVKADRKQYRSHRVIFLIVEGRWPAETIDHINRVKTDNRWANLREATRTENNRNRDISGPRALPNVYQMPNSGRFEARARVNGRKRRLGTYDTAEEAVAAIQRRRAGLLL